MANGNSSNVRKEEGRVGETAVSHVHGAPCPAVLPVCAELERQHQLLSPTQCSGPEAFVSAALWCPGDFRSAPETGKPHTEDVLSCPSADRCLIFGLLPHFLHKESKGTPEWVRSTEMCRHPHEALRGRGLCNSGFWGCLGWEEAHPESPCLPNLHAGERERDLPFQNQALKSKPQLS